MGGRQAYPGGLCCQAIPWLRQGGTYRILLTCAAQMTITIGGWYQIRPETEHYMIRHNLKCGAANEPQMWLEPARIAWMHSKLCSGVSCSKVGPTLRKRGAWHRKTLEIGGRRQKTSFKPTTPRNQPQHLSVFISQGEPTQGTLSFSFSFSRSQSSEPRCHTPTSTVTMADQNQSAAWPLADAQLSQEILDLVQQASRTVPLSRLSLDSINLALCIHGH